jgi:hypothetical protein
MSSIDMGGEPSAEESPVRLWMGSSRPARLEYRLYVGSIDA